MFRAFGFLGFRIKGLGVRGLDLGFRVRGIGFGVRDLENLDPTPQWRVNVRTTERDVPDRRVHRHGLRGLAFSVWVHCPWTVPSLLGPRRRTNTYVFLSKLV